MRKRMLIVLIIPLLLLMLRLSANTALAWYSTPVQSETLYGVAILGTTTEYGYEGPAAERNPQFYSGLIADGAPGTIFGFVYPELVKIEVSGTDPLGSTLAGDRFSALTVLSSPDDSEVEQRILKTIFDVIMHLGPSPIRAIVKNTLTEGGATTGWDSQKAWGMWQRPYYATLGEERGLRFGYQLVVEPAIEGTYTMNVHYHAWVCSYDGMTIHHVGYIDLYDTVYYNYVNTPLIPSTPSGPTMGHTGMESSYTTSTTDPNGDSLRYKFDWGDSSTTLTDWYTSGATASASHAWTSFGTFYVKVQAQDSTGEWSDWSQSLTVTIEPSLVAILNELGFTNIEEFVVETFDRGIYEVKLYAEFAGYHAFNSLSWYPVGTTYYNLIFSGSDGGHGYIEPPITKTFTANVEFGLSFHSPEARYFTETYKNPDGNKHAQVYVNLDNPHMFLIGFENRLGVESEDYNDMVISLEIINKPPNNPSTPSGSTSGYIGTSYTYITSTTDPDGDNVCYQFDWGDGSTTTTSWYTSGSTAYASHTWGSSGTYYVKVKAQDSYGVWSDWSPSLTVTMSSDGGGGGGGCPTLFVWDGRAFVEEGLLDIHAESDVTMTWTIHNLLTLKSGFYRLQLRELDNFTSHIDYVKLYAVDSQGNWHELILEGNGNAIAKLLYDDGNRLDLTSGESIDLRFSPTFQGEIAHFIFEINGYNPKYLLK